MTRLEGGTIALQRDWHSLADIAATVSRPQRERFPAHPLKINVSPDLPLLRVDASLIEQVLVNLLENAAKYTPHGTRVGVSAERQGDHMVVSVEDAGPGLPPGDLEQLFAKFHRGAAEGSVGGVGLGLPICRAIVTLHGGKIWAERRPMGGSAFRFTLPLEEAPAVPAEAA